MIYFDKRTRKFVEKAIGTNGRAQLRYKKNWWLGDDPPTTISRAQMNHLAHFGIFEWNDKKLCNLPVEEKWTSYLERATAAKTKNRSEASKAAWKKRRIAANEAAS